MEALQSVPRDKDTLDHFQLLLSLEGKEEVVHVWGMVSASNLPRARSRQLLFSRSYWRGQASSNPAM